MILRSQPRKRMVAFTASCVVAMMFIADLASLSAVFWLQTRVLDGTADRYWMVACVSAMFGSFGSQLLLAVLVASMGDGSSSRRILYTTFTVAIFTNLLVLFSIWLYGGTWSGHVSGFLMPLLFFYLLQIPFWGIRSYFGWMVASPWAEPNKHVRFRFTLTHLLGWSVFLAVPLCILQAMIAVPIILELWVFLFWAVIVCGLLAWLLYTSLSTRMSLGKGIVSAAAGVFLAVAILATVLWLWERRTMTEAYIALAASNVSGTAVVVACLALARSLGYRLLPFAAGASVRNDPPE